VFAATVNQFAEGVVYRVPGYNQGHEIELFVRLTITPHSARGYEVYYSNGGYVYLVRWNGPLNDFTVLTNTGIIGQANTGDVLRMEIVGTFITVKRNGISILTYNDTSGAAIASGQPGIGLNPFGASSDFVSYTFSSWNCGNI
jgi:hypothetical protein